MNTPARRSQVSSQRSVPAPGVAACRPASPPPGVARTARRWTRGRTLLLALALILGAVWGSPVAHAHAPALATVTSEVALVATPSPEAAVLALLPVGTEVELTGAADGAFLAVAAGGQVGWARADSLNGGIATATARVDVTLRAAPSADGAVLGAVPAGSTVMLTGAAVDGFLAAAFAGTGGWLPAAALA